jgi:hypothetical protein
MIVLKGNSQDTPKYLWNGKELTYKAWRDSLKFEYLKYCDSLKKNDKFATTKK